MSNTPITPKPHQYVAKQNETNNIFSFQVKIKKIEDIEHFCKNAYIFTLEGEHQAKNDLNKLKLQERILYENAIKEAFNRAMLIHGKKVLPYAPFKYSILNPYVFNPVTRDDDANYDTLKIFRDCMQIHKFILSDKRKNLYMAKDKETLTSEYKIMCLLIEDTEDEFLARNSTYLLDRLRGY